MGRALLPGTVSDDDVFDVSEADLDNIAMPTDPEVTYGLRPISVDAARRIFRKHTKRVPDRTGRRVEETNDVAIHDELLDYAIFRWTGVTNGSGGPAPCDLPHKKLLPGTIQAALIDRAQAGQGSKEESFRGPA